MGILVCSMHWGSHSRFSHCLPTPISGLPPPQYSLQGAQRTEVQQHAVRWEGGPKLLLQVVGPVQQGLQFLCKLSSL